MMGLGLALLKRIKIADCCVVAIKTQVSKNSNYQLKQWLAIFSVKCLEMFQEKACQGAG